MRIFRAIVEPTAVLVLLGCNTYFSFIAAEYA
jgi:hypothetical protein